MNTLSSCFYSSYSQATDFVDLTWQDCRGTLKFVLMLIPVYLAPNCALAGASIGLIAPDWTRQRVERARLLCGNIWGQLCYNSKAGALSSMISLALKISVLFLATMSFLPYLYTGYAIIVPAYWTSYDYEKQ